MEHPRLTGRSWAEFRRWLTDSGTATDTAGNYLYGFTKFLEWAELDTEELFNQQLANIREARRDEGDPRAVRDIPNKLDDFVKSLQSQGMKASSTIRHYSAVVKFFECNSLEFNGYRPEADKATIPGITKDQLRKVLSQSGNARTKAYFLTAKDTGLRTGDITRLTVGQLRPALDDPSIEFYTFETQTSKTGSMANPVLGPDSLNMIREWMDYRERKGISAEDSDPLFCGVKTVTAYTDTRGRNVKGATAGGFVDTSTFGVLFIKMRDKAGIKAVNGDKKPSIHSLRKYHKTNLEYAGCPTSWINKMQGRVGEGTGGLYTKPESAQLIEMYSRAYHGLALSEITAKASNGLREELIEAKTDFEAGKREQQAIFEAWKSGQEENRALKEMLLRMEARLKKLEESEQ